MKKLLLTLLCLAAVPAAAPAELLKEMPFDISSGVNPEGRLAVSFSVPVTLLDQVARDACVSAGMKLVDPAAPVVSAAGGDITIANIETSMGRPRLVLTPFSSGRNTIGFAVKQIEVDGSALVWLAKKLGITEEMVFDILMRRLETDFSKGLQQALESEVPTPQQLIWFSHDAPGMAVYMSLANAFALPAMPKMAFDSVSVEDGMVSVALSSVESAAEIASKGYVLAVDGRSLSTMIAKVVNQRDAEGRLKLAVYSASPGRPAANHATVSGFAADVPVSLGPVDLVYDATFDAEIYVYMPEPDFLCLEIRKVDVTWLGKRNEEIMLSSLAYSAASLGFVQRVIIERAVDRIAASPVAEDMAEISKLNASTVGIRLRKGAVLPVLSRYVDITGVRLENGKAYLSYSLDAGK